MPGIIVRDAKLSDYGFLMNVFASVNADHLAMRPDLYRKVDLSIPKWKFEALIKGQQLGGFKDRLCNIAEKDGERLGAVFAWSNKRSKLSWSTFPKTAYLDNIIVLPEYRRQGVGTALLQAAKEWAKDTGHAYMDAKILVENDTSLKLFQSAGFRADSTNVGIHLK